MNSTAWKWTRTGEAKVERPIASWNEKPATMTIVMTTAPRRKKRSSPIGSADGRSAKVAIGYPPGTLPVETFTLVVSLAPMSVLGGKRRLNPANTDVGHWRH